jgi:glucosylglycerate synthase
MRKNIDSSLSAEAHSHLEKIKQADILVGIPSYNNVLTATYVISQVISGLETHFPDMRSVIFVSDGNSVDGTLASVKTVHLPSKINLIPAVYVGISGKGSAIKAIFEASKYLRAKAVALVDSDLSSITPEWMKLLISPALSGTGLVVPYYSRRKYDGTITNFLCYPVTASLFGKEIRQPIGGDFGLSIELVEELLSSPLWKMNDVRSFGVDIFETHTALAKGFEVKQAFLGTKDHEPKDPAKQLSPMFRQVMGTMFTCIEQYELVWKGIRGISEIAGVGEPKHFSTQGPVQVDLQNMVATYKNGFSGHVHTYKSLLTEDVLKKIEHLQLEKKDSCFPPETWAKVVYSFIAGFHKAPISERENIVDALRILWMGKVATFVKETAEITVEAAEIRLREEAKVFEKLKTYLIDRF